MEEKVKPLLESLGLTKNEVAVYLDLVTYPGSSPTDISKRTGVYRSSIYESLVRLEEKGFITQVIDGGKVDFHASDFDNLKMLAKKKEQEISELISLLKHFPVKKSFKEEQTHAEISHGELSVRNALFEALKSDEPVYILGAPLIAAKFIGAGVLKEFHQERISKKIPLKIIYSTSYLRRVATLNKMDFTEAKYMEFHKDSPLSILISGDKVFFMIFSESPLVIQIKNPEVAEFLVNDFELLWKEAKKE